MRVIRSSYFMSHKIFSTPSLKRSVIKKTTPITDKNFGGPISTKNILLHKLNHNLVWSLVLVGRASTHFDM